MKSSAKNRGVAFCIALCFAVLMSVAGAQAQSVTHAPCAPGSLDRRGRTSGSSARQNSLQLDIVLPLRNEAALDDLLERSTTPTARSITSI